MSSPLTRAAPLQNRVDPFGRLFTDSSRGLFMGNRGGRFHRDDRTLGKSRSVSRRWICCVLQFKNRHREVWGKGYTELFFLDELTALAAGHRPCFECRRRDANAFAARWAEARGQTRPPSADQMDVALHAERAGSGGKSQHRSLGGLPHGTFIAFDDEADAAFAVRAGRLRRWTSAGYTDSRVPPRNVTVSVLTPPSIVAVLAAGYAPAWHGSAES